MQFTENGLTSGSGIVRFGPSAFILPDVGTYEVFWQVSVTEAGQLQLWLGATVLAYTTVGRATGSNQIVGDTLVRTTSPGQVLSVRNPNGNASALTITAAPVTGAGSSTLRDPFSGVLLITRIA